MSSSASLSRRLRVVEDRALPLDQGKPFLFFPALQTYTEALAFAGLVDQAGPVVPIRVVGVRSPLDLPT